MGYAVPAALAMKLIHPNRPVVAVCGVDDLGGLLVAAFGLVELAEGGDGVLRFGSEAAQRRHRGQADFDILVLQRIGQRRHRLLRIGGDFAQRFGGRPANA